MMDMHELADQLRLPHGENSAAVTEMMAESNKALYHLAFQNIDLFPGAKLLEVGPADGRFVKDFFEIENDLTYSGLDLSKDMIIQANKLNSNLVDQKKAEFISGDVTALPFENNLFDRIVTINTLYFWPDVKKGINELTRVLKANGKILIVIRSRETMEKMPFTQYGFKLFSEDELKKLLYDNGHKHFRIETISEQIVLPNGSDAELIAFCAIIEKK